MNTHARNPTNGGMGFSLSNPEKEGFRTRVIRSGKSSQPDVRIIRVDNGGSRSSSLGAERL